MNFHRFKTCIFMMVIVIGPISTMSTVSQAARERTTVDVVEKKRKASKKDRPKAPTLSKAEVYAAQIQKKLIKGISKTIKYLNKTAKKFPKKSPSRYEVQFKLLNLYLENAVYVSSEEHQAYSRKWEKWNLGGGKGPEPKLSTKSSTMLWRNVARQAKVTLDEFPNAKDADQILFNQALALQFLNRNDEAARVFSKLIQKYSNSQVAGDAYFALGDYYFDRNDFRNAKSNYTSALRYRRSKRYGWALFKLGWSYFNLGQYKESLAAWKRTVSYSRTNKTQGIRIKEEAMRDMVYAFAELRQVDPAIAYYRANGGKQFIKGFLQLLANTFIDHGQFNEAVKVFRRFQTSYPLDEETPNTQKEIISLSFEMGRMSTLWGELEKLSRDYGPKSKWAQKFSSADKKVYLETQKMIKDQLIYYPKVIYSHTGKSKNNRGYDQAYKGFALFLKYYPKARESAEIKFIMADILYFKKQYRESGEMFMEVAKLGKKDAVKYDPKTNKPINIHKEAAEYMIGSMLEDFDPEFKRLMKTKPDMKRPPRTLSRSATNVIKSCSLYIEWYPKDTTRVQKCDVITAEIYYRHNDRKNALKYFWNIANKYPTSPQGEKAVRNLIGLYKNDKKGMLAAVSRLQKIKQYKSGKLGKDLAELRWSTENESISKEKDRFKRAQLYEAQAKQNPNALEADKLWFNAAVDYVNVGEINRAINAYKTLYTKYPKSEKSEEALSAVAKLYKKKYDFNNASQYFLVFVKKYPKSKEAAGAFSAACEMQIAINHADAVNTCLAFSAKYPQGGVIVLEKLIAMMDRKNKHGKMQELINRHYIGKYKLSANDKIRAYYRIYSASKGQGSGAQQASSRIISEFRQSRNSVSGEALRYVGEIYYKGVGDIVSGYTKSKLTGGTVDNMLKSMNTMTVNLEGIKGRYQKVIETGDSYWGVAALYQIGSAYLHLAKQLENPPGIKGAKIEDVKKQLAPQAQAIRGESKAYFVNAMKTIEKFNVYNDWAVKVVNGLAEAEGRDRSFDELVIVPDFVGVRAPAEVVSAL